MSKKVKTYLMLTVVTLIWGKIGYDLLTRGSDEVVPVQVALSVPEVDTTSKLYGGYEISGKYRDPFLGKTSKRQSSSKGTRPKQKPKPKLEPQAVQSVQWPLLEYIGVMSNKTGGKQSAIVNVNGVQKVLIQNQTIQGMGVEAIYPDSILLAKEGHTKTIYK